MFFYLPDPGGIWPSLEVFSVNNMSKQFEYGRRIHFFYAHPVSGKNYRIDAWYSNKLSKTLRKLCDRLGLDLTTVRCLEGRKCREVNIYTDSPCSLGLVEDEISTLSLR